MVATYHPLLVGLLGVFAGAVMVAIFHCVVVCYGGHETATVRQRMTASPPLDNRRQNVIRENEEEDPSNYPVLELIVASSYSKECEEEICAVCLNEFMEGDEVRVLPECSHVFHVACIDRWLTSRGNCPLCRSDTLSAAVDSVPATPPSISPPI